MEVVHAAPGKLTSDCYVATNPWTARNTVPTLSPICTEIIWNDSPLNTS